MKKYNKCSQFSLPCAYPIPDPVLPPKTFTDVSSFADNRTGGAIIIPLLAAGGFLVPFPNDQTLSGGITVNNPTDTKFTVPNAGRYLIDYQVNLIAGVLISSQLLINDAPIPATKITALAGLLLSEFKNTTILKLNAGDTVSLQLCGLAAVVNTSFLTDSVGATLTIVQVSN